MCLMIKVLMFALLPGNSQTESNLNDDENRFENCLLAYQDFFEFYPWSLTLRVLLAEEADTYWPITIISRHILLSNGKPFRAPNRKLRVLTSENYTISINSEQSKPQFEQNLQIAHIKPHPQIRNTIDHWMRAENDIVLIHLSTPINFTDQTRPLCMPKWNSTDWEDKVNQSIIQPGHVSHIYGWKCNYNSLRLLKEGCFELTVKGYDQCRDIWLNQAEGSLDQDMDYKDRVCGSVRDVEGSASGPEQEFDDEPPDPIICSEKAYYNIHRTIHPNGLYEAKLYGLFSGSQELFVNPAAYISLFPPETLTWIENSTNCGPFNYTCNNGECILLELVCDREEDCADGSDEDPTYCRARNHCPEFECGVYGSCIRFLNDDGKNVANCDGVVDCPNGEDEDAGICFWLTTTTQMPTTDFPSTKLISSSEPSTGYPEPEPVTVKEKPKPWIFYNWDYVVGGTTFIVLVIVGLIILKKILKPQCHLSDAEILEFRQGLVSREMERNLDNNDDPTIQLGQLNSQQMPYIYDLPKNTFQFGLEIGAGAFGTVYKGTVEGNTVAIKVLKRDIVDKDMFKALLSELKVMAYLNYIKGGHQNIVKLIGAYTEEIRDLVLFIAVEFCAHGSISDYLKNNKNSFQMIDRASSYLQTQLRGLGQNYVNAALLQQTVDLSPSGLFNLNKWAQQIVDGMCFLSRHQIVHGDLAARNVLLDQNLTAKVCDFGLSRQIYYYNLSSAKINTGTQLPWRWMAPEVIGEMKISIKSDVWSFGVTMWELFTLGGVPYGGLEWSPQFIDQLNCGLRLTKPQFASAQMYDERFAIIEDCWQQNTNVRPGFETLRRRLMQSLNTAAVTGNYANRRADIDIYIPRIPAENVFAFRGRRSVGQRKILGSPRLRRSLQYSNHHRL